MTDTDNTPATISRLAIGALIAGIIAVILLATQPFDGQAWTAIAAAAAIVLAGVDVADSRRNHRHLSYMSTIGAILAILALVCAFIVWPAIR